jgi:hypothetical protein
MEDFFIYGTQLFFSAASFIILYFPVLQEIFNLFKNTKNYKPWVKKTSV